MSDMRVALVALVGAGLLAGVAVAVDPHPRALVLAASDVPRGFVLDRARSGVRTNAAESRGKPRIQQLLARTGRTTGYQAEFERGQLTIGSRVDVFRSAAGADAFLRWYVAELQKPTLRGMVRARIRLGAGGWLYRSPLTPNVALVLWRRGRVTAAVLGAGVLHSRTVALARVQDRRIADALG